MQIYVIIFINFGFINTDKMYLLTNVLSICLLCCIDERRDLMGEYILCLCNILYYDIKGKS